jgi:hypothetical protein
MPAKMTALSKKDVDCTKFNTQGKTSTKSHPPTQKKGRNQASSSGDRMASARDNQKLTLTANYKRNQKSPILAEIVPLPLTSALFAEQNMNCGNAENFML